MFKGLKRALIVTGLIAGSGYLVYEFVLSDRAKSALRFAGNALRESYGIITSTIDNAIGIVVPEPNSNYVAETTEARWNRIGF